MTMMATEALACPECASEQQVDIWSTINVTVNLELRGKLFDGQINVFGCANCGYQALLGAPLLYHDQVRGFAVQFFPPEAIESDDFIETFERSYPVTFAGFSGRDLGYLGSPHLVFDMTDLLNCIMFYERLLTDAG